MNTLIEFRKKLILTLFVLFISSASLANEAVDKQASEDKPSCITKRVSEISDPSRKTDFLIHICGEEVTTEFVDKQIEANEAKSNAKQEPKKAWEEASSWADLIAQESMAGSTRIIMFATVLGAVVGTFGLIYLVRTFEATKRTADAAEKAERAYVFIEYAVRVHEDESSGAERTFSIHPVIKNYGKTPALDVDYRIWRTDNINSPASKPDDSTWAIITHNSETTKHGVIDYIGADKKSKINDFAGDAGGLNQLNKWVGRQRNSNLLCLWARVQYRDVFTGEINGFVMHSILKFSCFGPIELLSMDSKEAEITPNIKGTMVIKTRSKITKSISKSRSDKASNKR